MAYALEGQLLEVCDCNTLCPCWVGDDPDNGSCKGTLAWHFDKGTIDGVDVSGLTFALLCDIPGNILQGKWRVKAFVDAKANAAQESAILAVYTGKKGGPIADLAKLVGEVVAVERVPIAFEVAQGKGWLRIGQSVTANMEPFRGPDGRPTALSDSIFSTIPGSPAYVGKAETYKAAVPEIGFDVDLRGHNSVQGSFRFQHG